MLMRFMLQYSLLCLLLTTVALDGNAQSYDARAHVTSAELLGRGESGIAVPSLASVFFYNPAHVVQVAHSQPTVTLASVQGSLTPSLIDHIGFFAEDLRPAIKQGIPTLQNQQQDALYAAALERGAAPAHFSGTMQLPSFVVRHGLIGIGGGVFMHSHVSNHYAAHVSGTPTLTFLALGDVMAVGSAAIRLPLAWLGDLSLGITGKATRRYLTTQQQALDALDQAEPFYVLTANSFSTDVGLLYRANPFFLPGRISVGAALYDIVNTGFPYKAQHTINTSQATRDGEQRVESWAHDYVRLSPSFRLGSAWLLPELGSLMTATALMLDYADTFDTYASLGFWQRFGIGAQTTVGQTFSFRLGLRHGQPSYGLGVHLGRVTLDYAYYGVATLGTYTQAHHAIQFTLRKG